MEFYFNELSTSDVNEDKGDLLRWVSIFVKTCIEAKKYGFNTLRSSVYFSQIEITPNYNLGDWMKDRNVEDREIQRKFKSFDSKIPLIDRTDAMYQQFEDSLFKFSSIQTFGLGLAFLKTSFSVSFKSLLVWEHNLLPLSYEYIDEANELQTITVEVRNVSSPDDVLNQKAFIIERLKTQPVSTDWDPTEKYLPNDEVSNNLLDIANFYENLRGRSKGEQNALIRLKGREVATLNHYEFNKELSDKNKTNEKLRDIYQSQNITGRTIYLSVDFEKGAYEVCDDTGTHLKEILFNGNNNGGPDPQGHSIKL